MNKTKISFKSISPIILSPRMEAALYKGVDFERVENEEGVKIIYPFYSREDRRFAADRVFASAEEYYIPASSLKGALLGNFGKEDSKKEQDEAKTEENNEKNTKKDIRERIWFRDIPIDSFKIKREAVFKFQYLYQDRTVRTSSKDQEKNASSELVYKTPRLEEFFPGVQVEMIKPEQTFAGEVLLRISEEEFRAILQESFEATEEKLKNYIEETKERREVISRWDLEENNSESQLERIREKLQQQLGGSKNLIFLGGYKGILSSLSNWDKEKHRVQNGFYIDRNTQLPYGLVEVRTL